MKTIILTLLMSIGAMSFAQSSNPLNLYPNPATDHMYVQVPDNFSGATNIYVTDMNGRVVTAVKTNLDEYAFRKVELELANLDKGYYFINVEDNTNREVQQFIKD